MGAGASADIGRRLSAGESLSGVAFNSEFLYEDVEFDPRVGDALLGDRFTGADVSQVEWVRPKFFGSGELFRNVSSANAARRFDPNDCLGALSGYNRDLVVAVQLLCARRPDYLESAIECYNPRVGCAAVWLYHNGKMQLVVIDDRIPCLPCDPDDGSAFDHRPLSASLRTGEAWLPLLEKAMAKLHGSYTASALGDGLRDIIRDLTGDCVIDVSLARLGARAQADLFSALYRRFLSGRLGLAARKSVESSFTCDERQRVSCIADLIRADPNNGAIHGAPPNSVDHLGNALQAKAGIPAQDLEAIRVRASTRGEQPETDGLFVALIADESVPFSTNVDDDDNDVYDDTRADDGDDDSIDASLKANSPFLGPGRLAKESSSKPLHHSQSFTAPRRSKPPKWLSWAQFCEDYMLLSVAVLPATGHVCGRNARLDNPFLRTSGGAGAGSGAGAEHDEPDVDASRDAYVQKLSGLGSTIASAWDHFRGTAGGGAHLPTFRDNPAFRCQLHKPHPRKGKLVVTLSLIDGRREGEIACRGGGGGGRGGGGGGGFSSKAVSFLDESGAAGIDLADWDGDQEGGGTLLYPKAAVRIVHDEPSLQHVLVATDYHSQRDHSIEMELDLTGTDHNSRGGRPFRSFVIVPCLLEYGAELSFFISAAFIDDESGMRSSVELSRLESFPGWEFTRTLKGKWTVGHTAAGRVGAINPYSFLNPAWRMELLPSDMYGAADDQSQGATGTAGSAADEHKSDGLFAPDTVASALRAAAAAAAGATNDDASKSEQSGSPSRARPHKKRDLTVHRLQVLLVLRVFPQEPYFFLGDTGEPAATATVEVESLAAKGTTGGRGNIPPPGNPRGSGGSRGLRSALGNQRSSRGGTGDAYTDKLVALGLASAPPVPREYPYDPMRFNSAVYIMTPSAYAQLVHHAGACGDVGLDDGYIGQQIFAHGAFSYRCEYLSAIKASAPLSRQRMKATATDPKAATKERIDAYRYAKRHAGYSIGTDVYDELVIMPALWDAMVEGQFELEVYSNLPFALTRVDYGDVSAPILTTRQKSIAARHQQHKDVEEREKQRRIRRHRSSSNRAKLETMEKGEFTLREDYLVPRAVKERLLEAESFYGTGMLKAEPENAERAMLRDTVVATMPHEGLAFHDLGSNVDVEGEGGPVPEQPEEGGLAPADLAPLGGSVLGMSVSDLSNASVTSHIQSVRSSIAVKIKKDTDARLFSLRMKAIENATRMETFSGVGDSSPIPQQLPRPR